VFLRDEHWRFDGYGRNVFVPGRPRVLIGKAEDNAEKPKITEQLENARMKSASGFVRDSLE
jgi:hypothetical protein